MSDMHERLADALLRRVYYRVSAVASLDARGGLTCIQLFDTEFAGEYMRVDREAHRVLLLSCHPEGMMEPYDADLIHAAALRAAAPHAELEMYLVNEDLGCVRIALPGSKQVYLHDKNRNGELKESVSF